MNRQVVKPKGIYEGINADPTQEIESFIDSCCEPNQSWICHPLPQIDSFNPDVLYSFRITEEIKGTLYYLGICTIIKSQFDRMTDDDKNKMRDDIKDEVSMMKIQVKKVLARVA
jgi:hypothetical protein